MENVTLIQELNDIDKMLETSNNEAVILLKHSNSCPISSAGYSEFEQLVDEGIPLYMVVVQEARASSNEIAERLAVTHQTPQVIIISAGEAKADMSHYKIKKDAVLAAFQDITVEAN